VIYVADLGQPKTAGEVEAKRTPLAEGTLLEVLAAGHVRTTGDKPSANRLGMGWAQVALETGRTVSCWNYNFGNITRTKDWSGPWHRLPVGPGEPTQYRSYGSPLEGAADYWRLLTTRYTHAMPAFDAGDPYAAAHELKAAGYYQADEDDYAAAMASLVGEYHRRFLELGWARRLAPLLATATLAALTAYLDRS
jgi:hypothetical protein